MGHSRLDPTKLGTVEDVSGSRVSVKLAEETAHGMLFVCGEGYRVGQVGSFVRIPAGYVDLFGIVAQVGAGAAPGSADAIPHLGNRWLRVELVGEGRRGDKFRRGISQYPSIGDSVHVVTESNLSEIYAPGDVASHVAIGRIASAEGIPAYLDMNRLLSRHSAVVGSTGAGKSTAVASLLCAVSSADRFPAGRVVLLDLHGEYVRAFGDRARVFRVNADKSQSERELQIPFWALSAEELVAVSMGSVQSVVLSTLLDQVVALKKDAKPAKSKHTVPLDDVTVDTPLPFSIHKLWYELHCLHNATHTVSSNQNQSEATRAWKVDQKGINLAGSAIPLRRPEFLPENKGDGQKIYLSEHVNKPKTHIESLEAKLRDPRMKFLFDPGEWAVSEDGTTDRDLDALLDHWIGSGPPISVFDLSGIPPAILDDLVGALLRILYDALLWGRQLPEGGRQRPLLVVLEEAHVYLGTRAKDGSSVSGGRAAAAARRIAKEGRKYGVGLMLVSQRPSEIDTTILSQCGTLVALRLTNDVDRGQIRSCSSDNLEGLFAMLPILRTGEALIVGEAVGMPVRTLIDLPPKERRPDSEDPLVVVPRGIDGRRQRPGGWTEPLTRADFKPLIEAWRRQDIRVRKEQAIPDAKKAPTKKG